MQKFHKASFSKEKPCVVLDPNWSNNSEEQSFREFYSIGSGSTSRSTPASSEPEGPWIDPEEVNGAAWDELVAHTLPNELLLYASDCDNVSLLSYERRDGVHPSDRMVGLDMTRLQANDCLFRAVMTAKASSNADAGVGNPESQPMGGNLPPASSMAAFSSASSSATKPPPECPGMTTCYTYFARCYSVFAAHAEDHNLPSINQLVYGRPKVWFTVPPAYYRQANDVLRAGAAKGELPSCPQSIAHKLLLPSLALLTSAGIPVHRFIQRAGDLMITAAGAIHFGINTGDNVAESTNVADAAWISSGAFQAYRDLGACSCSEKNKWSLIPRVCLGEDVVPGRLGRLVTVEAARLERMQRRREEKARRRAAAQGGAAATGVDEAPSPAGAAAPVTPSHPSGSSSTVTVPIYAAFGLPPPPPPLAPQRKVMLKLKFGASAGGVAATTLTSSPTSGSSADTAGATAFDDAVQRFAAAQAALAATMAGMASPAVTGSCSIEAIDQLQPNSFRKRTRDADADGFDLQLPASG